MANQMGNQLKKENKKVITKRSGPLLHLFSFKTPSIL
jgi:hypothetical protein